MWVREMVVSIVTVLSRLPSLAATTEAKFSAPAESKAMVNLPVFIHPLPLSSICPSVLTRGSLTLCVHSGDVM